MYNFVHVYMYVFYISLARKNGNGRLLEDYQSIDQSLRRLSQIGVHITTHY